MLPSRHALSDLQGLFAQENRQKYHTRSALLDRDIGHGSVFESPPNLPAALATSNRIRLPSSSKASLLIAVMTPGWGSWEHFLAPLDGQVVLRSQGSNES